jgi:hypothetical protein
MTIVQQCIPVGANRDPRPMAAVRTPAQHKTVLDILAADGFAYACNNPFTPAVEDYQGPFMFLWYDRSDNLHGTRIAKRGQILRDTVVEAEPS